jgi:hypothetical protein
LHEGTGVGAFLDRHDLAPAWTFVSQIEERIAKDHVVFLALQTGTFASRTWCRQEVATARVERRPIIVVDARVGSSAKALPFVGHAPVLQWQPGSSDFCRSLLRTVLTEALRFAYVPAYLESVERLWRGNSEGSIHVPRQPDLIDVARPECRRLLHPDPPLVPGEAQIFRKAFASLALATPSTLSLMP